MIRYQFCPEAAVQASAYLLRALGGRADKTKLAKLLYLADKAHFLKFGSPITGDTQSALPHGPLPSCTLNLLNGLDDDLNEYVSKHVVCDRWQFVQSGEVAVDALTETAIGVLDETLDTYGQLHTWAIKRLTHDLPEYRECEVPGSSAPIPYEVILKHSGANHVRNGRPVITTAMAMHMLCPFPCSEPDL